jgi:microcin C transport system permease protein
VTGLGSFFGVFLAGSLIIEKIFTLDGIGLLGFKSTLARDYNVIMALIFISSLVSLVGRLISDLLYVAVDPRIDFE